MGYKENINSILKWGNSFQRQFDFPLDRSSLHGSYADAVAYAKGDGSDSRKLGGQAYIGQTITVWGLNEKGKEGVWVYSLVPSAEGSGYLADLKPVGSTTTETAETYSAAKTLSEGLVVGQLILVSNEETVGEGEQQQTYKAGFYIVNAPGTISALDTSTGASDEIGALTSRVAAVEGKATTLESKVSALESNRVLTSDFEAYKTEISTALAAKVETSAFTEYQSTVTSALAAKVETTTLVSYQTEVSNALAAKVDTTTLTSYQTEVSTALSGIQTALKNKVESTTFASYKTEVSSALAEKATTTALSTLEQKVDVDIQNLTTHLSDYANNLLEVDGRIDSLETFVSKHVGHDAIEISEIEGLFTEQPQE